MEKGDDLKDKKVKDKSEMRVLSLKEAYSRRRLAWLRVHAINSVLTSPRDRN